MTAKEMTKMGEEISRDILKQMAEMQIKAKNEIPTLEGVASLQDELVDRAGAEDMKTVAVNTILTLSDKRILVKGKKMVTMAEKGCQTFVKGREKETPDNKGPLISGFEGPLPEILLLQTTA